MQNVRGMENDFLVHLAKNREEWQGFVVGMIDTNSQLGKVRKANLQFKGFLKENKDRKNLRDSEKISNKKND